MRIILILQQTFLNIQKNLSLRLTTSVRITMFTAVSRYVFAKQNEYIKLFNGRKSQQLWPIPACTLSLELSGTVYNK